MCFTRIYGFIFCDSKVINSSLETIDNALTNDLPVNIARKVSYTTDTLNTVYVYGEEDSSQNVFQGIEYRTGTETNKRYRFQQDSNGYIRFYRRKSDDSGWETVYSGNISLISTLQSSISALESNLTLESKRFFHFSSTNAPSGYKAVQVIFDVDATSPILIVDRDNNCFIVNELWDNITSTLKTANVYWINNAGTIRYVQCAKYWNNTQYRIKLIYNELISIGGFLSLDGRARFSFQEFVDQ